MNKFPIGYSYENDTPAEGTWVGIIESDITQEQFMAYLDDACDDKPFPDVTSIDDVVFAFGTDTDSPTQIDVLADFKNEGRLSVDNIFKLMIKKVKNTTPAAKCNLVGSAMWVDFNR
jgi:hypothetical protein